MLLTLSNSLIVYSIKKFHETHSCSSSIAFLEKRTGWTLRIFTFNDKNPLNLPIISTLQFLFEGQRDQGLTQLVKKPFEISEKIRNSESKVKKITGFSKPLFNFYFFFQTIPLNNSLQKNSENNSLPSIIKVICKYLQQFLGTSFGIAILLISCNIEQGIGSGFISESFQNFQKFFRELPWLK